jgi:hypothetical protein
MDLLTLAGVSVAYVRKLEETYFLSSFISIIVPTLNRSNSTIAKHMFGSFPRPSLVDYHNLANFVGDLYSKYYSILSFARILESSRLIL